MIYFVLGRETRRIKIGYSTDVLRRFAELISNSPDDLELLGIYDGQVKESTLHKTFAKFSIRNEWFTYSPEISEWINRYAVAAESVIEAEQALIREEKEKELERVTKNLRESIALEKAANEVSDSVALLRTIQSSYPGSETPSGDQIIILGSSDEVVIDDINKELPEVEN